MPSADPRLGFPLVDCHAHVGRLPGTVGRVISGDDLHYALTREGVAYTLASSASVTTVGQPFGNAEAVREVARRPDTIGGMIWINPHDPAWADDARSTLDHGFLGIKLHPVLDHYRVTREALSGVFAFAARHHLAILTHAAEGGARPLHYVDLVERYPDVDVVFAHFGPGVEGILMAKKYDNAYLDTTLVPAPSIYIAVDSAGAEKVLFGTDAPIGYKTSAGPDLPEHRTFRRATDAIRALGLPDADLDDVFYRNAARVFHIPPTRLR
jgi:predicted TIM-barrel fold metal-dependent hydrolase